MYKIILNANENPFNADEDLKKRILKRLESVDFNRYPDPDSERIKELFASYLKVNKENVTTGNGSDEVLRNLISFYCKCSDDILFFEKDFSMYSYYANLHGLNPHYYEIQGDFRADKFIKYAQDLRPAMVIFSNPNNPTARLISREDIRLILEGLKETIVVVDEAYMEFADESVIQDIEDFENLFVTRTMSKAIGMASIRVGVCLSQAENIDFMEDQKAPYNINSLSQAAVEEVFSEDNLTLVKERISYIKDERDRVLEELEVINVQGLRVFPSAANFIYFESKEAEEICQAFDEAGILIRKFEGQENFRISIGTKEENDMVLDVFRRL